MVVLGDALSGSPVGYWSGPRRPSTRARARCASNPSNTGNIFSALFVPEGEPAPGADPDGLVARGDAARDDAQPRRRRRRLPARDDGAATATDGYDVMCYDDGGLGEPLDDVRLRAHRRRHAPGLRLRPRRLLQRRAAAPAATSRRTGTSTTTSTSAAARAIAPACGGDRPTRRSCPPVVTADPQVYGAAKVGSSLTATRGTWSNVADAYAYQWERGDGGSWSADRRRHRQRATRRAPPTPGSACASASSPPTATAARPPTRRRRRRDRRLASADARPGRAGHRPRRRHARCRRHGSTLAPAGAPAARRPAGPRPADRRRRPRQGQAPRHDRVLRRLGRHGDLLPARGSGSPRAATS